MSKKYEMKTLNTYDEAFKIGSKYIRALNQSASQNKNAMQNKNQTDMPPQIENPIWTMTIESLGNTLKYIFELLHHQCYMLCINNNNILMCKLDMQTTAPIFSQIIDKQLANLDRNVTITQAQRTYIRETINKNKDRLRVMQCIVKPFSKETGTNNENEYLKILKGIDLPNGVFILNLTDAVILRNHGKSPFAMVTGKVNLDQEFVFDKHLPILSISGQRHYLDIPIPNYDDIMTVLKQKNVSSSNLKKQTLHQYKITQATQQEVKNVQWDNGLITDWTKKKKNKAVFRGGPTGCGYTTETNMRLKLDSIKSSLIDVRLTKQEGAQSIDTKSIRFDPIYGLGVMNTRVNYANNFLNMIQQSDYKYIIHVDGNVNAYRLLTTMTTGSLVLRVMSPYTSWADHMLKAKVHYIPVKEDLSDLLDVIKWCRRNDERCKEIANNGLTFARSILNKNYIQSYLRQILWSLAPNQEKKQDIVYDNSVFFNKEKEKEISTNDEYIEMPANKSQCPKGYKSALHDGQKKCKKTLKKPAKTQGKTTQGKTIKEKTTKNKTKKVRFVEGPTNEGLTNEGPTNEGPTNEGPTNEGLTNEGLTNEEYIDIPEGKKQCPKGYKAALNNGRKRCKKNITLKNM